MADWKRPFIANASQGNLEMEYEKGDWRIGKSDKYVITGTKDISAYLEVNKRDFNDGDHSNKRIGNKTMRHAARLDPVFLPELYANGAIWPGTAWKVRDMAKFEAWLDDPDRRCVRTWPGKIGHMKTSNQGRSPSEAK